MLSLLSRVLPCKAKWVGPGFGKLMGASAEVGRAYLTDGLMCSGLGFDIGKIHRPCKFYTRIDGQPFLGNK